MQQKLSYIYNYRIFTKRRKQNLGMIKYDLDNAINGQVRVSLRGFRKINI